jgi:glycosyltransferase involved in cell wall biosynthesis
MKKLTVALATYNEEANIEACLDSVKDIAEEIVVVDGSSTDQTVSIAKRYNAKVIITDNPSIFHLNKQKAIDHATHEWILQLDADERVSKALSDEIKKIVSMSSQELESYQLSLPNRKLFLRHQKLLEQRDGTIGTKIGEYTAFFVPRLNYFLGKYLRYGGVYPDGVIRLVKKGKAHFPCIDVHEQIAISGKVGWLQHDLIHMADPTFKRYMQRNNRYTDLIAQQMKEKDEQTTPANSAKYMLALPTWWFLLTFFRHKGFLDLWQGFIFSFFSSLRFPISYVKYMKNKKKSS